MFKDWNNSFICFNLKIFVLLGQSSMNSIDTFPRICNISPVPENLYTFAFASFIPYQIACRACIVHAHVIKLLMELSLCSATNQLDNLGSVPTGVQGGREGGKEGRKEGKGGGNLMVQRKSNRA